MSVLTMIPFSQKNWRQSLLPQVQCSWMSWRPLGVLQSNWLEVNAAGNRTGVLAVSEERECKNSPRAWSLPLWEKHKSHFCYRSPLRRLCSGRAVRVGKGHISSGPLSIMNWCPQTHLWPKRCLWLTPLHLPPPRLFSLLFLPPETVCMFILSVPLSAVNDARWWSLSYSVNHLAQADAFLASLPWCHLRPRLWGGTFVSILLVTI